MRGLGPTARAAINAAAEAYELTVEDVLSRKRAQEYVLARRMAMGILHGHGWTLSRIGRIWGMDHTTVRYALQQHKEGK